MIWYSVSRSAGFAKFWEWDSFLHYFCFNWGFDVH